MSQRMDFNSLLKNQDVTSDKLDRAWQESKISTKEAGVKKINDGLMLATEHPNLAAIEWLVHQWQIQRNDPHEKLHLHDLIAKAKAKGFTEIAEYFHQVAAVINLSYIKRIERPHYQFIYAGTREATVAVDLAVVTLEAKK